MFAAPRRDASHGLRAPSAFTRGSRHPATATGDRIVAPDEHDPPIWQGRRQRQDSGRGCHGGRVAGRRSPGRTARPRAPHPGCCLAFRWPTSPRSSMRASASYASRSPCCACSTRAAVVASSTRSSTCVLRPRWALTLSVARRRPPLSKSVRRLDPRVRPRPAVPDERGESGPVSPDVPDRRWPRRVVVVGQGDPRSVRSDTRGPGATYLCGHRQKAARRQVIDGRLRLGRRSPR